jgi:addiction module RelE/StbE family toxin
MFMIIEYHPSFKKSYKKRIARNERLVVKIEERLDLFISNPHHPILKNHVLQGKKTDFRAFSVTGDIRIVYLSISSNHVLLLDIGSHTQVY